MDASPHGVLLKIQLSGLHAVFIARKPEHVQGNAGYISHRSLCTCSASVHQVFLSVVINFLTMRLAIYLGGLVCILSCYRLWVRASTYRRSEPPASPTKIPWMGDLMGILWYKMDHFQRLR